MDYCLREVSLATRYDGTFLRKWFTCREFDVFIWLDHNRLVRFEIDMRVIPGRPLLTWHSDQLDLSKVQCLAIRQEDRFFGIKGSPVSDGVITWLSSRRKRKICRLVVERTPATHCYSASELTPTEFDVIHRVLLDWAGVPKGYLRRRWLGSLAFWRH